MHDRSVYTNRHAQCMFLMTCSNQILTYTCTNVHIQIPYRCVDMLENRLTFSNMAEKFDNCDFKGPSSSSCVVL